MKKKHITHPAILGSLAIVLSGCLPKTPRAPGPPADSRMTSPSGAASGPHAFDCSAAALPGNYLATSAGSLLLAIGEKPPLSLQLASQHAVSVEDRQGQLVLKVDGAPAVSCELKFSCSSATFAQMQFEQQCVFNFASVSPAHTEDVVFELLKGEGSVSGGAMDIRLEWKAKSRREYDRATGRLSVDLAVGTLGQSLRLTKR